MCDSFAAAMTVILARVEVRRQMASFWSVVGCERKQGDP